jgi:RNA polymerase sigma-70 factor (ECF subfamily)
MGVNAVIEEEVGVRARRDQRMEAHPRRDSSLVRRAKAGSPDAVATLVRKHWLGAHRTALLIVQDERAAEDVAQEAMLAAVQSLERFDWRRPFAPWLHRIVVNRALDYVRAQERRSEVSRERPESNAFDDLEFAHDQSSHGVAEALRRLEPVDRAIVLLRHLLDYRSREIGRLVEMPAATVRTRLRRAMTQLRETLEHERGIDQERMR